jgi:hypothetical protein
MKDTLEEFEDNWGQGSFPGWPVSSFLDFANFVLRADD